MSFSTPIPTGVSIASAAAIGLIPTIIFGHARIIGPFVAQITAEEQHVDELEVTEQPVQQGAAITDHSYKRPARLRVTVGYSNSNGLGNPALVQEIYAGFLALQATRIPFEVLTGKRFYTNMLLTRLSTITNEKYENSMLLDCEMKEVILVNTQTLTVPPAAQMKSPEINGSTINGGTKSLLPGSSYNAAAAPAGVPEITVFHVPGR